MGRIQSNIGLITGIPIADTVDQLIQVASQPRDLLSSRTEALQSQQLAISRLSTRLLSLQFSFNKLKVGALYAAREVTSSKPEVLAASLSSSGQPSVGSFDIRAVQAASSQQFVSQRFEDFDNGLGTGTFSFGFGGFLDKGIALDELNSGAGVARGQIRITDLDGASSVIDLSFARTVDDVLGAISNDTTIHVTAVAVGDAIKLVDHTGGTGTLSVQEVAGGTTAAGLGLEGISTTAPEAVGADVFRLHAGTKLSKLNDGNGVRITDDLSDVDDLTIALADGNSYGVDLSGVTTLGGVVLAINSDADLIGKTTAAISADGKRLELTDQTTGAGTFAVANGPLGTAAEDLGLTETANGGVITGRRLISGLKGTLVRSLQGGQAGTLGSITVTDRAGSSDTIDLSGAETVDDLLALINATSIQVLARLNDARSGILLEDTSGVTTGPLVVASADATSTAELLGIVVNADVHSIDGGSLSRQSLSPATPLSSLHGGTGFTLGDIAITDSDGVRKAVDLNRTGSEAKTVGDVIDAINALNFGVTAAINEAGDGLRLTDTAGGSGLLGVQDLSGTVAASLNLTGASTTVDLNGTPTQQIDGTRRYSVDLSELDGSSNQSVLDKLASRINELEAGVTASTIFDGVGYRLSLSVDKTGVANELLIDQTGSVLTTNEVSRAQDALLVYAAQATPGSGILISSATNDFNQVIHGVGLKIATTSDDLVTVTVASSDAPLVETVEDLVGAYNALRDELDELTSFNETDFTTGLLFGTTEALRVDTALSRLVTDRYVGLGAFDSLDEIGLSVDDQGKLQLDQEQLHDAFAKNPEGLEEFLTNEQSGVLAKFNAAIDRLTGAENGMLTNRTDALQSTIESNQGRIERLNESLDRQRERLLLQFYQLEQVIAGLQQSQTALSALQPITPLVST